MRTKAFFVTAATALLLASCNETNHTEPIDERIPIRISMSPLTRATDNAYEDGDEVGLYVSNYAGNASTTLLTTGNHADNVMFTNAGSVWTSDEQLYWKDNTTLTDFYAYYPYGTVSDVNSHSFSVLNDQSTIENLNASFFLWGKVSGQSPTEKPIAIETNHLMSSLRIYFEFDESMSEEEKEAYFISDFSLSVKTNAIIDIATGEVTATGGYNAVYPYNEGDCYRAIIVPQSGISVSLTANSEKYTTDFDITFQPNTQYKLYVTIKKDKLVLSNTFSIGGWKEEVEEYSGAMDVENLKKNIQFAYPEVKARCVEFCDTDGDGEISYMEAAQCSRVSFLSDGQEFSGMTFHEFRYFTSIEYLDDAMFITSYLRITLPPSIKYLYEYSLHGIEDITFTSVAPPSIESEHLFGDRVEIHVPNDGPYKDAWAEFAETLNNLQP